MPTYALLLALLFSASAHAQDSEGESDLSYKAYVHSDKRIKCLYGYAADKTGDHAAAVAIFEDCIRRWNDVYSMIWLAQLYETGIGVTKDLQQATALMRRGAHTNDDAAYAAGALSLWRGAGRRPGHAARHSPGQNLAAPGGAGGRAGGGRLPEPPGQCGAVGTAPASITRWLRSGPGGSPCAAPVRGQP